VVSIEDEFTYLEVAEWNTSLVSERIDEEEKIQLENALGQLGEQCRKLLVLCYFHNYSTEALQHEFDYSSVDVVRTKKYRCIKVSVRAKAS
jgi:DNA-directed RNA polymerase specialized sigma24 family protein